MNELDAAESDVEVKRWRVLVVDDEPNNLQLLRQILKARYHISLATSGEKALSLAEKFEPDLILLDIEMPFLDGYELYSLLQKHPYLRNIQD